MEMLHVHIQHANMPEKLLREPGNNPRKRLHLLHEIHIGRQNESRMRERLQFPPLCGDLRRQSRLLQRSMQQLHPPPVQRQRSRHLGSFISSGRCPQILIRDHPIHSTFTTGDVSVHIKQKKIFNSIRCGFNLVIDDGLIFVKLKDSGILAR